MARQGASGIETPTPLCLRALGGSTFLYLAVAFFSLSRRTLKFYGWTPITITSYLRE
jgi:hypothetical protein